jgi:ribose transport system ATP-binding protein
MTPVPPALEFRGIGKAFFGVPVLREISFAVAPGTIVGLVGENGAGKSTLMNILAGIHQPDAGRMARNGTAFQPRHPLDANRRGIAFIQQELNLFPNLSIAENLFLSRFPTNRLRWLRRHEMAERARALLAQVGLVLPPETRVERLSPGEAQLVEIAKALGIDARVIIFDEPTTSLTFRETERLFALMQELRARGTASIFISHNLGDVVRISDDIVVLRDGQLVAQGPKNDFDEARLITAMVGRTLSQIFPSRIEHPPGEPLLEVVSISQPAIVRNISLTLHRGEVLGLAGLMGSGRSELARIIFGLDPHARGEIRFAGRRLKPCPRGNVRQGIAFVTENRREEGLCLAASIADNMALVSLRAHARRPFGWLHGGTLRTALDRMREAVRLTPAANLDQPARTLSGGNQQKVVLAKWLLANPKVVILDEPTRGVDVGAKAELYELIAALRTRGAGVLVISSELEELLGLCDRILVMNRGEIRDELTRSEFDRERILRAALHERPALRETTS